MPASSLALLKRQLARRIAAAGCAGVAKPARISVMKPSAALATHRDKLLAIAAGHRASNLRVFGSVAKEPTRRGATATRSRACAGDRRRSARTVAR